MIELIFVIVIIGILAAVAIPKLAANRTKAQATVCVHEVGQFISEVSATYTVKGYTDFIPLTASDMTNIHTSKSKESGRNGIIDKTINGDGVDYYCDGNNIVHISGKSNDGNYTMTVKVAGSAKSPAAMTAIKDIKKSVLNGEQTKDYSL